MLVSALLFALGSVAIVSLSLGLVAAYTLKRTNSLKDLRYVAEVIRAFRRDSSR